MSSEAAFSKVFVRVNFRSEVATDVISGVAVDQVGMDVRLKFGDLYRISRSGFNRESRSFPMLPQPIMLIGPEMASLSASGCQGIGEECSLYV